MLRLDRFFRLSKKEKIVFLDCLSSSSCKNLKEEGEDIYLQKIIFFLKKCDYDMMHYFLERSRSTKLGKLLLRNDDFHQYAVNLSSGHSLPQTPLFFPSDEDAKELNNEEYIFLNMGDYFLFADHDGNSVKFDTYIAEDFCVLIPFGNNQELKEKWGCFLYNFMKRKMEDPKTRLEYLTKNYEIFISKK
jgi:hypothetical protein